MNAFSCPSCGADFETDIIEVYPHILAAQCPFCKEEITQNIETGECYIEEQGQSKFTKGPWEVQGSGNDDWEIVGKGFTVCMNNVDDTAEKPEESWANAQLIAASPELYEALRQLKERAYNALIEIAPENAGLWHSMIQEAEAALAKADGK